MAQPIVSIHLSGSSRLEQRAAKELCRYIRQLFGIEPSIVSSLPSRGKVLSLGTPASNPMMADARFSDDDAFVLRRRRAPKLDVCELIGASPFSVQYAAYEAIKQWGVHYLIRGDVFPSRPTGFRLPDSSDVFVPICKTRVFRLLDGMINSGTVWGLADQERLLDQLVKLRFNAVYLVLYAHEPWVKWSFRGVRAENRQLIYGFEHLIHERSIGVELFGGPGEYTNPDVRGCGSFEQRLEKCQELLHGIFAAAHARGIRCILSHDLTDLPEEAKRRLPEWSRSFSAPRSSPTPIHPHSLGLARDGGQLRFGHWMTPLNPAYVAAIESWLGAHLREYREIDGLELHQHEFPAASGVTRCWKELNARHHLSKHCSLRDLLAEGEKLQFHTPGRGLLQTRAAIVMLRLLDLVINEHRLVDRVHPNLRIYGRFMNHLVMPLVPYIFDPSRFEFVATIDYTPADVAARIDSLAFARKSSMPVHLITTIEDDNVGILPQLNTVPLATIVRKMHTYRVSGYWFRQWLVSKHEPVTAFLAEAGWNRSASAHRVYAAQVRGVCGARAVAPMMRAFSLLEKTLPLVNSTVGVGFMMPGLARRFWERAASQPIDVLRALVEAYKQTMVALRTARTRSKPSGHEYVDDYIAFIEFARLYLTAVLQIVAARRAHDQANQIRKRSGVLDIDGFDDALRQTACLLSEAGKTLQQAMRTWASAVRDPGDLGTLAGLNVYGLDYLRGKADEARLRAEHWGYETAPGTEI